MTVVKRFGVAVFQDLRRAVTVANLHHRVNRHEKPRHFDDIHQGAAAVVAEVNHKTVHSLRFELFDFNADVLGTGTAIFVGEVRIKLGQLDMSTFIGVAVFDRRRTGIGFLEHHDVANDRDDFRAAIGFLDRQAHFRSF